MLYKTNKHKENKLIKYTTQEHTGYVERYKRNAATILRMNKTLYRK